MDVTLHGVMDREIRRRLSEADGEGDVAYPIVASMPECHPYLEEHPEWFSRHESGEVATTYTYAFDHSSPGW